MEAGLADDTPEPLKRSSALRALYNNLLKAGGAAVPGAQAANPGAEYTGTSDRSLRLAMDIDEAIMRVRPDGWRGVQAREQVIKAELYKFVNDVAEVERLFLIVKAQREY